MTFDFFAYKKSQNKLRRVDECPILIYISRENSGNIIYLIYFRNFTELFEKFIL